MTIEHLWNATDSGKPKWLEKNVSLCPQQISHRLTWDQTRASVVRGQQLTTSAVTWPVKLTKNWKSFSMKSSPISKKSIAFWIVPWLHPLALLVRATCRWIWVRRIVGMIMKEKTEILGDELSLCHFVHQKSHTDWPGIESIFHSKEYQEMFTEIRWTCNERMMGSQHLFRSVLCMFLIHNFVMDFNEIWYWLSIWQILKQNVCISWIQLLFYIKFKFKLHKISWNQFFIQKNK